MKLALRLARKGWGMTYPNPMVGAVIVKEGVIIGAGWHQGSGKPHAEVNAIRACRVSPVGAELFVTLEPCNHYGRTPPCTKAIIEAGIEKVYYAISDPNPEVLGGGAAALQQAGIAVEAGMEHEAALELNRGFFRLAQTGRPWVILKAAMSLDGKTACPGGISKWITGLPARKCAHRLRAQMGAILVGVGTVNADDPELSNRLYEPILRQPLKVILDSSLRINFGSKIIKHTPAEVLIFCTAEADRERENALQALGVRVIRQPHAGKVNINGVLATLGELGIQSLMVEGGHEINAAFLKENLFDEYYLFYAPILIGSDAAIGLLGATGINLPEAALRVKINRIKKIGNDLLIHSYRKDVT